METYLNSTVGEIVTKDFRTASVFSEYGIDFCCGGDVTLQKACEDQAVNISELQEKLNNVTRNEKTDDTDFSSWELDVLVDYIEKTYHQYIKSETPLILQHLKKIQEVHGERHPELSEILDLFSQAAVALGSHLLKEERILFPVIRQLAQSKKSGQNMERGHFGSVENPINAMKYEHVVEGDRFKKISDLSHKYTMPADGCNTYWITYAQLNEFEQKLHQHIHLENNILFPKSIELEQSFF
jgi:regulator of cell morphogenesis and NO signaling